MEWLAETPADRCGSDEDVPVHTLAVTRDQANKPVAYVYVDVDDLIGLAQGMCLRMLVL